MAIAGRVAIVPKGDWSANATYKRLDAVTYNNPLYFAKKDVPAGTATSNTEYWSKSIVGGAGAIATTEDAGIVKPDGKSMSVDESGTLSINLDGTTITLDEAKNVIKLADTLKDKIGSALQPESIVNNQTTTVEGFALDARQANPNIDGTLAKQVADLNGSFYKIERIGNLNNLTDGSVDIGIDLTSYDFLAINPYGGPLCAFVPFTDKSNIRFAGIQTDGNTISVYELICRVDKSKITVIKNCAYLFPNMIEFQLQFYDLYGMKHYL